MIITSSLKKLRDAIFSFKNCLWTSYSSLTFYNYALIIRFFSKASINVCSRENWVVFYYIKFSFTVSSHAMIKTLSTIRISFSKMLFLPMSLTCIIFLFLTLFLSLLQYYCLFLPDILHLFFYSLFLSFFLHLSGNKFFKIHCKFCNGKTSFSINSRSHAVK